MSLKISYRQDRSINTIGGFLIGEENSPNNRKMVYALVNVLNLKKGVYDGYQSS